MKKLDSKPNNETLEEEYKRLRKEVRQKEAKNLRTEKKLNSTKKKLKHTKAELKKKDVKTVTVTEEQKKLLSALFPDIDILF